MANYDNPAFSEGTLFSELFTVVPEKDVREIVRQSPAWTNYDVSGSPIRHRRGEDTGKIGGYFVHHPADGSHRSFFVQPTQKLVDWINEHMLIVNRDTIHFEGWVRGFEMRVNACYGQIIGSHFLGSFDLGDFSKALENS